VVEGTSPRFVLCCAARQGGRYLGLVELADPVGGAPFSEVDTNALEYLCGQLGEFIANRPLVLDDDVVLANR
jgi:GAF domain-containing protein